MRLTWSVAEANVVYLNLARPASSYRVRRRHPTQAAVDYFRCIKSPEKELILIPNAGHFAFLTASDRFLEALTSKIRRAAHEGGERTSVSNRSIN